MNRVERLVCVYCYYRRRTTGGGPTFLCPCALDRNQARNISSRPTDEIGYLHFYCCSTSFMFLSLYCNQDRHAMHSCLSLQSINYEITEYDPVATNTCCNRVSTVAAGDTQVTPALRTVTYMYYVPRGVSPKRNAIKKKKAEKGSLIGGCVLRKKRHIPARLRKQPAWLLLCCLWCGGASLWGLWTTRLPHTPRVSITHRFARFSQQAI